MAEAHAEAHIEAHAEVHIEAQAEVQAEAHVAAKAQAEIFTVGSSMVELRTSARTAPTRQSLGRVAGPHSWAD